MQPIWINARKLRNNATLCERKLWRHLRGRRLGSQHSEERDYDALRTRRMETNGYRVLRFWNNELLQCRDGVLGVILKVCNERAR
ncbi:DUF559 domain-containing protein [Lysobacter sp. 2RAF19]